MATTTSSKPKTAKQKSEQDYLAAKAQAKAKAAARISASNIKRVQAKLGGKKPSVMLGIGAGDLAQLASGKKRKAALKEEQRAALRDFGSALGSDTYYGKKLAGMLWAIETGAGH